MKWATSGLLALLLASTLLVTGCADNDWQDLLDFGKWWADTHDATDGQGNVSYQKAVNKATAGSAGDEQSQAILEAGMSVKRMDYAEAARAKALKEKDPEAMNPAIAVRPKDFRYHNEKGALLLAEGKTVEARASFATADAVSSPYGKLTRIRNLSSRIQAITEITGEHGLVMDDKEYLLSLYRERYRLTNDPADKRKIDELERDISYAK